MRCGRKKLRHGRKDCTKLNGQTKRSVEDVRKKKSPGSTDRIVNRIRKMQKVRSQNNDGNGNRMSRHQRKFGRDKHESYDNGREAF